MQIRSKMGRPRLLKPKGKVSVSYEYREIAQLDYHAGLLGLNRADFIRFLTRSYINQKPLNKPPEANNEQVA